MNYAWIDKNGVVLLFHLAGQPDPQPRKDLVRVDWDGVLPDPIWTKFVLAGQSVTEHPDSATARASAFAEAEQTKALARLAATEAAKDTSLPFEVRAELSRRATQ